MVLVSLIFSKQAQKVLTRGVHKYIPIMNKAYLRHLQEEEKFELTFHYVDETVKLNRQFNFCRQTSETVFSFTTRVATNLDKLLTKKAKKAKPLPVQVSLSVNGGVVSGHDVLCRQIFDPESPPNNIILHICQHNFQIVINSPWVNLMVLPSSIMANFPVYPTKFESVYTEKNSCKFTWSKCTNRGKNEWVKTGEGFVYTPTNNEIGCFVKICCLPKRGDVEGPLAEALSGGQVQAGPGPCSFETRHEFTKHKCVDRNFRVVSYNILADLYCDSEVTRTVLHPYCPQYALDIHYRKQLFIKEITGYNSDIVCLQEVDKKVFNYDLQPFFERLNYEGDFCQKRGQVAEGLACFFDKNRFKRLEAFRFQIADELNQNPLFQDIWEKVNDNKQLRDRILDKASVLQVNILQSLENERILIVGNTHLYFHPDADHIRLLQGAVAIKYLESIVSNYRQKFGKDTSLIFCGDFNSVPDCGIYQLYTTGSVQEDHVDFSSNKEEAVKVPLSQSLRLQSACGTPKYTNFTAGFADCLDYIFYEKQKFEVVQVVPFPSIEELTQHTALPSIVFPSDHIALISDLKWI